LPIGAIPGKICWFQASRWSLLAQFSTMFMNISIKILAVRQKTYNGLLRKNELLLILGAEKKNSDLFSYNIDIKKGSEREQSPGQIMKTLNFLYVGQKFAWWETSGGLSRSI
jgi:hypothetical protein